MSDFILVTGGARSGKSHFAELLAAYPQLPVIYVATAQVYDEEMAVRVKKHQHQRPSHWGLEEEPLNLPEVLEKYRHTEGVILVDCVTLWLTNMLLTNYPDESILSNKEFSQAIEELEHSIMERVQQAGRLAQEITPQVIMVTNEVGNGIVPDNPLSRVYRDMAGRANQTLGRLATKVYNVVAGYPAEIKAEGQRLLDSLRRGQ